MRTTLALDDDVFAFARSEAQRQRISIGEAISRLARDGIRSRGAPLLQHAFKFESEIRGNTNGGECGGFHPLIVLQMQCITDGHFNHLGPSITPLKRFNVNDDVKR